MGKAHLFDVRNELIRQFSVAAHSGQLYKFELLDAEGQLRIKADPYAFEAQMRPETASLICGLPEKTTLSPERQKANGFDQPISIYGGGGHPNS